MMMKRSHSSSSVLDDYTRYRNSTIAFCLIVLLLYLLFFRTSEAGEAVYIEAQEDSLYLSSNTGEEITISYADITGMELTEIFPADAPTDGTENDEVRSGIWSSSEYGECLLFTLNDLGNYIILTTDSETVVFNYESDEVTAAIYASLQEVTNAREILHE